MADEKRSFWVGVGAWLLRRVKPLLKKLLLEELVPMLQEKIDAGAIDKQVDEALKIAIEEYIVDKL